MTCIEYDGPGELYITNITEARKMNTEEIDTVITVCQTPINESVRKDTKYEFYCLSDGPCSSDMYGKCTYDLFEEAANMLFTELSDNKTVLIHCRAGQSRSVSVSAAVLGRLLTVPRDEALDLVHSSRTTFTDPDPLLVDHIDDYIEKYTDIEPPFSEYQDT